jgi:hypothetical protein
MAYDLIQLPNSAAMEEQLIMFDRVVLSWVFERVRL